MMKREDGAFGSPKSKPSENNLRQKGAFGTPIRGDISELQRDDHSGASSQQNSAAAQPPLPEQAQQHALAAEHDAAIGSHNGAIEESQALNLGGSEEFFGLSMCIGFREKSDDSEDYGCNIM